MRPESNLQIAMFSTSLPELDRKPGGVDVLITRVANELTDRGHSVTVYSFARNAPSLRARLVSLHPAWIRYRRLGRMLVVPLLLNFVRFRGDVLHLHGDDWFFIRRRMPTLRTFYGSARDEARTATSWKRRISQSVIYRLELLSARLAVATYALLPGDGREYGARGALNCGVETAPHSDVALTSNPSVLFVGTWEGRKRGAWLADQFATAVLPALPEAELWMVSDRVEDLPFIRHVRHPSDRELADLYSRCWVFCLPSTYEGFGIPYLEAMAAGTPVVATPNPGSLELLGGGKFGLLADDKSLGAAILDLLTHPDRRTSLAELGRRRVEEFSWDLVTRAYLDAYAETVREWEDRHSSRVSSTNETVRRC